MGTCHEEFRSDNVTARPRDGTVYCGLLYPTDRRTATDVVVTQARRPCTFTAGCIYGHVLMTHISRRVQDFACVSRVPGTYDRLRALL